MEELSDAQTETDSYITRLFLAMAEGMLAMSFSFTAHPAFLPQGLNEINIQFSSGMVNAMIGMGTWRIREVLHPITSFAVQRIEGTWREAFAEGVPLCLPCGHATTHNATSSIIMAATVSSRPSFICTHLL